MIDSGEDYLDILGGEQARLYPSVKPAYNKSTVLFVKLSTKLTAMCMSHGTRLHCEPHSGVVAPLFSRQADGGLVRGETCGKREPFKPILRHCLPHLACPENLRSSHLRSRRG